MKKEVVYTMPYETAEEIKVVRDLRSELYEKFDQVDIFINGRSEVKVTATNEKETETPELYQQDREEIARLIMEGYTSGILDREGEWIDEEEKTPDARISWNLSTEIF